MFVVMKTGGKQYKVATGDTRKATPAAPTTDNLIIKVT